MFICNEVSGVFQIPCRGLRFTLLRLMAAAASPLRLSSSPLSPHDSKENRPVLFRLYPLPASVTKQQKVCSIAK